MRKPKHDYEIYVAYVEDTRVGVQVRKPSERWQPVVNLYPGDSVHVTHRAPPPPPRYDSEGKYIVYPEDR